MSGYYEWARQCVQCGDNSYLIFGVGVVSLQLQLRILHLSL